MTRRTSGRARRLAFAVVLAHTNLHASGDFESMADLTNGPSSRQSRAGMDYTPPARTDAFKAAGRHTARVKFLRRAMIIGAIVGIFGIAIVTVINPFRHLPGSMSITGVGVSGTRITMEHPKLSGVQQGGGPYQITAKAGIQDITKPSIIELVGVDANVGMADATTTHILANSGIYDSKADSMSLTDDVKIANTSGYTLNMKSATIDFRAGLLSSHERLRVDLKGGTVSADDMAISNNGHVIDFKGHVTSSFDPPEEAQGAPSTNAPSANVTDEEPQQ